jgi:hypothetical protein
MVPARAIHWHEILAGRLQGICRHTVIVPVRGSERFAAHRRESETEPTRKNFLTGMGRNARDESIEACIARKK